MVNAGQNMVAFDTLGGVKWIVPGYTPQMATADGGIIATSGGSFDPISGTFVSGGATTFDSTGSATGQLGTLSTESWIGNAYQPGAVEQVASSSVPLAGTYAALSGGNHSGSGTAIQQVLTRQPQGDEKQLPVVLYGCQNTTPLILPIGGPTCGNINVIELSTDKPPDYIFQNYIQTYVPATVAANQPNNAEMIFTGPDGSSQINVTGPGQKLTITLRGVARLGQGPFSVLTERFDPVNHVISVVTLKGHPLAGWRYWRVYAVGTNDVAIETGAYDQPGPGPLNYFGYFLAQGVVSKGWKHYLQFIQKDLQAPQLFNLNGTFGGIQIPHYPSSRHLLLDGFWDYGEQYINYILDNVCQSTSCN